MGSGGKEYKWIWTGAVLAVVLVGVFVFIPSDDPIREPATKMSPAAQPSDPPGRDDPATASQTQKGSTEKPQSTQLSAGSDDATATSAETVEREKESAASQAPLAGAGEQPAPREDRSGSGEIAQSSKPTVSPPPKSESKPISEIAQSSKPTVSPPPKSETKPISKIEPLVKPSTTPTPEPKAEPPVKTRGANRGPETTSGSPPIDYNRIEKDQALKALMKKRKEQLGIDDGVDIIARLDESIKIGDQLIPMKEIIDEIRIQKGEVVEKNLSSTETEPDQKPIISAEIFGIHVVQPGENIWNIHFSLLKNYFAHRGVKMPSMADEPIGGGRSSGVGKLLKFSENIVSIYNIRTRKVASDLHMIVPLTKIVIYNMERIFSLLDQIDYRQLNRIQFDGVTVWVPS